MDDLDKTDIAILRILQTQARLTNEEIGKLVHRSASAVSRRIAELQEQEYILGFQVVLNRKKLGLSHMVSTLVKLNNHRPEARDTFEKAITEQFRNILQWSRLQGAWDYLLVFVSRDMDHYQELYRQLTAIEGVLLTRGHTPMYVSLPAPLPLPIHKSAL